MNKLLTTLFCVATLFCGSVGAFKVDLSKVPPECRKSLGDIHAYSACLKEVKAKLEATPAPANENPDQSKTETED